MIEKTNATSKQVASMILGSHIEERTGAWGMFNAKLYSPAESRREEFIALRNKLNELMKNSFDVRNQREIVAISEKMEKMLILRDDQDFPNAVTTEGKNAALTHFLKGSSYSATVRMGLIGNTSYTAPDAADTAAQINTTGSANNWNEAAASVCASRGTPTIGTPSAGSVSLSSALSFSIIGTDTINGVFLLIPSTVPTPPTSTVGNTAGALWSCGALSVARAVINGDTLNVSYTTGL